MVDVHVPNGASVRLGRVEGQLTVGNNARIQAEDGRLLIVTGGAEFKGNAKLDCNLECESLRLERFGRLKTTGDLMVHKALDVSNSIEVGGTVKAESVDVGGHIIARSVLCKRMRVGGTAEVLDMLSADSVEVGGKIEARGKLDVKDLQVGGKAELGGGTIMGTINVGGKFETSSGLEFGELRIYGVGSLAMASKGRKIVASGKLDAGGDLQCDEIDISGVASVSGDCKAVRVEVNGKLDVSGSLTASDRLDVHGLTGVSKILSGGTLRVGGRLSAERAIFSQDAELFGSLETRSGLKARSVVICSGTRCAGPIVAETVEVGESGPRFSAHLWGQRIRVQAGTSQVEDVYATELVIGPGSRAKRLYAKSVELGSGCDIDEVNYVTELKMGDHVKIIHPVKKVERLREPPL
jgi:cytoskeletal protein CcmA (bactofilin family)